MAENDQKTSGKSLFEMTRVFKAPRQRIWKAWSEADQLEHWWGPKGCTVDSSHLEFRPAASFTMR
jgi:uncharacterized protein YndB with AHSA1/START domain